jgi:hypothetical protein
MQNSFPPQKAEKKELRLAGPSLREHCHGTRGLRDLRGLRRRQLQGKEGLRCCNGQEIPRLGSSGPLKQFTSLTASPVRRAIIPSLHRENLLGVDLVSGLASCRAVYVLLP